MKNKFLQEMQDRGYLNQCTDIEKLVEICNKKSSLDILDLTVRQEVYMLEVYFK